MKSKILFIYFSLCIFFFFFFVNFNNLSWFFIGEWVGKYYLKKLKWLLWYNNIPGIWRCYCELQERKKKEKDVKKCVN